MRISSFRLAGISFTFFAALHAAWAADGVVLIDQNRALAGGITAGDAPGFPVTISQPGSYRLSGNLTMPATSGINAIEITASGVTLDLNGFTIQGASSNLQGVLVTSATNVVVRNGTIQGFGGNGVFFEGPNSGDGVAGASVENIRTVSNLDGIVLFGSGQALHCTAISNISFGIAFEGGQVVPADGSLLSGNVAIFNNTRGGGAGISAQCPANVIGNSAAGNGGNGTNLFLLGNGCNTSNNLNPNP